MADFALLRKLVLRKPYFIFFLKQLIGTRNLSADTDLNLFLKLKYG